MLLIQNITKVYADTCVLQPFSLAVEKGEMVAIIGESGSGKTTLLSILSGEVKPSAGEVYLDDTPLPLYENRLIRPFASVKLVPQDYQLRPEHKIWENIDLALTAYTRAYRQERVAYLLDLMGITAIANKKPREVSGGEKQRTAIARAVAEEPDVLLLDEPFSNLDPIHRVHLRKQLRRLVTDEGISCLFVTHDVLDAFLIADRIGIVYGGVLRLLGTPAEVLAYKEKDVYVQEFLDKAIEPMNAFREKFGLI